MKKLILTLCAVLFALSAHAQFFACGEFGFQTGKSPTAITIAPTAGYTLNEQFSVGVGFGYSNVEDDYTQISVNPFIRYRFLDLGPVKVFTDGSISLISHKNEVTDNKSSVFQIGLKPGLAIPITEHLAFEGHIGFLGYVKDDDNVAGGSRTQINLNGENFSAGICIEF